MDLYFLLILTACLICTDTSDGLSFHLLSIPIATTFLISWVTGLFANIRIFLRILFGEVIILICIVDSFCQINFHSPISPQIFTNILLSDYREKSEFLSQFIGLDVLFQWQILVLILLALSLPICLVRGRKLNIQNDKWKITNILIPIFCFVYSLPASYQYAQLFLQQQLENIEGFIFRHYHGTPLHRLAFAIYASKLSANTLDGIRHTTYSAVVDSCSYKSPHIVLIIGESYNKHHSSLYGYHLPTTPQQQKRMKNGELYLYTDVVSPWNITSNVFLDIFSLWDHHSKTKVDSNPLFPVLFCKAGYMVSFFSNQYVLKSFHKGATNQAGNFFLSDRELSNSLFMFRNQRGVRYDMDLTQQLLDFKRGAKPAYTLDIIHLKGQHFEYSKRYPHSQAVFTLNDYADRPISNEAKQIVMHYDNATRYNDMVLDSLLSLYSKEEVVVVFLADHGEEVYDSQPVHGRLFSEPTKEIATQEYEVPMWIWCSESYQANHQNIVNAIKASQDKPFITERLPHLLLALAGISCRWSNDSQNILSMQYKCSRRIIGGSTDYDIQTKSIGKGK